MDLPLRWALLILGAVKLAKVEKVVKLAYNKVKILLHARCRVMKIKPSASIRKNYNDIAELCKESGEPVYLTKNGEGDLVVMDIEAFTRRESMLRLREHLVAVEEERLSGKNGYSVDDTITMMQAAVREVIDGKRK
jgi:PHD/YefM family antitoxin component YafN of YafNO toxin-antitoxin module